ncbi:putative acyl carrier protein [Fibrobacter succinogenes subsp. succinogenes S85]|jgi:acyl carrier protein|uniref:Phosphopantetheine-binding protein n=2 Tax=Fibrobacter succinogenes TaxID=833 RepID=C9RPQ8_FIBSS|nr:MULTISPECIES: acyl carrier protein [Fibrobacter]MBP5441558.1 acyl carrier protein [Fibrobacter sp.]ACX76590.1 phosphopantetheine-binding protein [Fibrobacter succinogenes subsp. succinogenes S85]ADL25979.1 putative acyl carrier protein [Fibrobacter succinogenes subsp. succinogenes S85]OWV16678.1 acyl carrier protein [Fibrobacter sp. UWB3]OWV24319.1 acyl carrier protein [Fibrobacter sp. UWB2]
MDKQVIFEKIKAALIEDFDLEENRIVPEARLYEDLELDSIDAVDLIVKLKSFLPRNIDPEAFKKMRTLENVVDGIYNLVQNSESK